MKWLLISIFFLGSVFASYFIGYYNGTNSATFLLAVNGAVTNIGTINYIERAQYNEAKRVNFTNLEANVAAMEDIYSLSGKILKIPSRVNLYKESLSVERDDMRSMLDSIRPKYAKLKEKFLMPEN